MRKPTGEYVEYTKLLLGHRTRFEKTEDSDAVHEISHYQPVPVGGTGGGTPSVTVGAGEDRLRVAIPLQRRGRRFETVCAHRD